MRRKTKLIVVAALLVAVAGGAYAAKNGSAAQRSPVSAADHGKREFVKAKCGACHTLAAAKAKGKVGPSLDGSRMTLARLKAIIRKGKGKKMPAFGKKLGTHNIEHLAVYIYTVRKKPKPGPAPKPAPKPAATTGEAVWAKAACGSCHALAAAGATATRGPSLDEIKPSVAEIVEIVANGDEFGAMPGFKGSLTTAEIQLVADYVVRVRKP